MRIGKSILIHIIDHGLLYFNFFNCGNLFCIYRMSNKFIQKESSSWTVQSRGIFVVSHLLYTTCRCSNSLYNFVHILFFVFYITTITTSFSYIFVYCFSFSVYSIHQTALLVMQPMLIRLLAAKFLCDCSRFLTSHLYQKVDNNSIEQYRAAFGLFYMSGRGISKKHPFFGVFKCIHTPFTQ